MPTYNGVMTQQASVFRQNMAQPLPWQWFEFRQRPLAFKRAMLAEAFNPDRVYSLEIDSHAIPFKFITRPPGAGGARPVLLMLHGMGLTIATFRDIAPYLLATHDLLLPDYSGFSQEGSSLPDHASFKSFALSGWRIADALGIERLSLAGNSLGGGLCLMACLIAPQRVDRVVLSNPACFPQQLPRTYRLARTPLVGELFMFITPPERFIEGVEYIGYVDKSRFDPVLRGLYVANLSTRRNRRRV
ncbi:MAG TPA: alpha/beta fold hydrolase, partial [Phycisphaerae bacterium]